MTARQRNGVVLSHVVNLIALLVVVWVSNSSTLTAGVAPWRRTLWALLLVVGGVFAIVDHYRTDWSVANFPSLLWTEAVSFASTSVGLALAPLAFVLENEWLLAAVLVSAVSLVLTLFPYVASNPRVYHVYLIVLPPFLGTVLVCGALWVVGLTRTAFAFALIYAGLSAIVGPYLMRKGGAPELHSLQAFVHALAVSIVACGLYTA